ncbi:MAG: hypothetical protein FJ333_11205, partial [Sphingomonadales bacterium]|nr:hypothetical protein [Sphingomonadales bacterium]
IFLSASLIKLCITKFNKKFSEFTRPTRDQIVQANFPELPERIDGDLHIVEREDKNNVGVQIQSLKKLKQFKDACTLTDSNSPNQNLPFSVSHLRSDEEFKSWTGVTKGFFLALTKLIRQDQESESETKKQLLLFLVKLKTNLSFTALSALFCIHLNTVNRIFNHVLEILYNAAKNLIFWIPRSTVLARMPATFKELYPNCRVIIDATEIKCEKPKTLTQQVQMYSNYKGNFTVKFLVGIAPSGEFTFLSKTFWRSCY